jgi:hypothetical protein
MSKVAAIFWKCATRKSYLSYMIVDTITKYTYLQAKKITLEDSEAKVFEKNAKDAISDFFKLAKENNDDGKIKIRCKIYFKGSHGKGYNPGATTVFVQHEFDRHVKEMKPIVKVDSLKCNLSGKKLAEFESALFDYVLTGETRDEYKHRVWAVALLVRGHTHLSVIKSLKRFKPEPHVKKGIERLAQVRQKRS